MQYCRRRAQRNESTRPRACHYCRKKKTKCDFERPCSRCSREGIECAYGTYHGAFVSRVTTPNAGIWRPGSSVDNLGIVTGVSPRIFDNGSITPSFMSRECDSGFILPFDSQRPDGVDSPSDTRPAFCDEIFVRGPLPRDGEIPSLPLPSSPSLDGINAFLLAEDVPSHTLTPSTPLVARNPGDTSTDVLSLIPVPDRSIGAPSMACSRRISKGCRHYILSVIRTYPRMMATPDNLPPYVHRVGCGLHLDDQDAGLNSAEAEAFAPLKPLAACYGIAQVFASRGPNTSDFLWRTVDNEHRLIRDKVSVLVVRGGLRRWDERITLTDIHHHPRYTSILVERCSPPRRRCRYILSCGLSTTAAATSSRIEI